MKTKLLPTSFARMAPALFLALAGSILPLSAHSQVTSWSAFDDFYVNVPATGGAGDFPQSAWASLAGQYPYLTGLTTPNAWSYAGGNFNGVGAPASVGTYLSASSGLLYPLTAGGTYAGPGVSYILGGGNFWIGYNDSYGSVGLPNAQTQIGKYTLEWFSGSPNFANNAGGVNNKYLWVQPTGLSPSSDGLGAIVMWTAPTLGTYVISGSYVNGNYGQTNHFAIVDSQNRTLLSKQTLPPSSAESTFSITNTYAAGEVIQFQVGAPAAAQGSPLGLAVNIVQNLPTSWSAYNDFYFDSTSTNNNVSSWTGAKSPSTAGRAWGYYIANANGGSFPSQIGSYFAPGVIGNGTNQALYAMANYQPLGVCNEQGAGFSDANDGWFDTGGKGTAVYKDKYGLNSSVGRFDMPWFSGAPGYAAGSGSGIWMQAGWLNNPSAEGICPVVTWTAPYPGVYKFQGSFVVADNGTTGGPNNLSQTTLAIVDSAGGKPLPRTFVAQGSTNAFSFTKLMNAGDVIQFQVGTAYQVGAAVSLNADVTLLQRNYSAFSDFWWSGRLAGTNNSANGFANWTNVAAATGQGRSTVTPTAQTSWSYGLINCTGGNTNDPYPTSITGDNPEGGILRAAWQQFFSLEDGVTARYVDSVPIWWYEGNGGSIGWYGTSWYAEAPGYTGDASKVNKKYLWMRVGSGPNDGSAAVVRWKAPAAGTYRFQGEFLPGGDGPGTLSAAILTYGNGDLQEGIDTILMNRQTVAHDGAAIPFNFTQTVVQGQTVTWVVGADGDPAGDVMGLQADVTPVKTELTLSGVSVASKTYNRNNAATLQATPTLVGVSPGDNVSLTNVVAFFDSPDAGSRNVSIAADLAGADASKYFLTLPTGITGTISKATPTISSAPTASAITQGQTLASSILSGGTGSVAGTFAWTTSSTIPLSTASYPVTFTPTDGANYNTATTSVSVTVNSATPTGASFTSWRGSSPASAALLQNYAFGAASPSSTLSKSSLPSSAVVSGKLVLTYYVRQEATNPNLVVPQLSTDLASPGNWADLGSSSIATISTDNVDGVQVVKKTASVPVDSTPRKFLRLKIQE